MNQHLIINTVLKSQEYQVDPLTRVASLAFIVIMLVVFVLITRFARDSVERFLSGLLAFIFMVVLLVVILDAMGVEL